MQQGIQGWLLGSDDTTYQTASLRLGYPHMDARAAVTALVDERFPACRAAFLAGSVVRGEATATSDLDLVVITDGTPYRASFHAFGWPVEAFVHTPTSYAEFFAHDAARRRPSLPMMCSEGLVLRNRDGLADHIKAVATALLAQGPAPLTPAEIRDLRYRLTDVLDDLIGSEDHAETLLVAAQVVAAAVDLVLGCHRQWTGHGKWLLRALRRFDRQLGTRLADALLRLQREGSKAPLVQFAEEALAPVGGRLFDGYVLGSPPR
jgi:hypothetical protein